MMELLLIPALYLAWAMSPLPISEGTKAEKNPFFATYPTVSINGNNPASQRVHEGGGFRLGALVTVAVQLALAFLPLGLMPVLLLQFAAIPLVFIATRQFIDVAEHGAEVMHGDSVTLDPDAQRWAQQRGFSTYSAGEVWRMKHLSRSQYGHLSEAEIEALLARRRWLSRAVLFLARW